MKTSSATLTVLLGLVGVLSPGCKDKATPNDTGLRYRKLTPQTRRQVHALTAGELALWLDLHRVISEKQSGNLLLSPASISLAFGMTLSGAKGDTAQQISKVMHFSENTHPSHEALLRHWADPKLGYTLLTANRVFVDKTVSLQKPFVRSTQQHYGSAAEALDISSEPEASGAHINAWVKERTRDMIPELIPQGSLSGQTVMVLVNALYLKGAWKHEFDKDETRDATFYAGERKQTVPMMHQKQTFKFTENDSVKVLELPYLGRGLVMRIILPIKRDGLPAVERSLTVEQINGWFAALHSEEVEVSLPRFKLSPPIVELGGALRKLGMVLPFHGADFSGITSQQAIRISEVFHGVVVEVNEQGTEAAAATAIDVGKSIDIPPTFTVDHPFLFFIQDTETQALLIAARVTDLS